MRALLSCLVVAAAIGAVTTTATATTNACRPTLGDTAGPFALSRLDAPRRAKIGAGHVLSGRIVRAGDCRPVARALVVLWQAGRTGYRPNGRGSVLTDRLGRFRFVGPVPTSYGGRPPHIHIAVIHPAYEDLFTRYVVRRGSTSGRLQLVLTPLL